MVGELKLLGEMPEWLIAVVDPEAVRAALQRHIPDFTSGRLTLRDVAAKRPRIKQGGWTASYVLTVDGLNGDGGTLPLKGFVSPIDRGHPDASWCEGVLGQQGWRCFLPELGLQLENVEPKSDAELPALPLLTDPVAARALLEKGIREGSERLEDITIQACTPKVVRYKPGSRCTIVYGLEFPPDADAHEWPELVVAKTYSGDKGRNAYDGMRALWRSDLGRGDVVALAEPLAFL
ncbi:MAG: hypothetical protein LC808_15930, partial [Actinobacteria bacterium]|nr:hypothetical protein [Actinomycetota bacterium]